jgi:Icc-related predicted phosphoesterase
VLIHAGDLTNLGTEEELREALTWLGRLPHAHKVVIAGNHDHLFESDPQTAAALVPKGVHYLEDSGLEIAGLRFWGSPVQPWFFGLAFNRERGADIARHWAMIPAGTDVLITHGPPYRHLDAIGGFDHGGCEMLRRRVVEIGPQLHVFGHLHEGYGTDFLGRTMLVNAAICNEAGRPGNAPIVIDL